MLAQKRATATQSNALQNRWVCSQNKVIQGLFCSENRGKAYNPWQRAGGKAMLTAGGGSGTCAFDESAALAPT